MKGTQMNNLKFKSMDLLPQTQKALNDMGFEEPTPIQTLTILPVLSGKDVIGQAQTGTGKTLAYAIPAVEMIEEKNPSPQFLILCPTRELALQVSETLRELLKYRKGANVVSIYGGQRIDIQIKAIKKGAHVIVGTPGRILDHIRRKTLRLSSVKMVVLDEADEMLNMGFIDDIRTILSKIPQERQTTLFSATMPRAILELSKRFQKDREFLKVPHKELVVSNVEQFYYRVYSTDKTELLSRLITIYNPESAMVFCNTRAKVNEVVDDLRFLGYNADALHGEMKQSARDRVMRGFRNKNIRILVATDVAARGIDVDNVEIIFNYDLPEHHEYYVHRVGRTGRMGKEGKAFTFITRGEMDRLKVIARYAKADIRPLKLPTLKEVEKIRYKVMIEKILQNMERDFPKRRYKNLIETFLNYGYSMEDLAITLLNMVDKGKESGYIPMKESIHEPPKENNKTKKREKRNISKFSRRYKN